MGVPLFFGSWCPSCLVGVEGAPTGQPPISYSFFAMAESRNAQLPERDLLNLLRSGWIFVLPELGSPNVDLLNPRPFR